MKMKMKREREMKSSVVGVSAVCEMEELVCVGKRQEMCLCVSHAAAKFGVCSSEFHDLKS